MSILSTLKSTYSTIVSKVSNIISKPSTPTYNNIPLVVPKETQAPSSFSQLASATSSFLKNPPAVTKADIAITSAISKGLAASAIVGAAIANPSVTASIASTLIKNPVKTIVGGAILSQTPKVLSANPDLPSKTLKASTDLVSTLGNIAANPSTALKETVKYTTDHPTATALIAIGAGAAAVKAGALQVIGGIENREAVKELIESQTANPTVPIATLPTNNITQKASAPNTPITPSTQVLGKSASVTKRRKRTKRVLRQATPSVRVNILNEQINI